MEEEWKMQRGARVERGAEEARAKWREMRQSNELLVVTNVKHWSRTRVLGIMSNYAHLRTFPGAGA